MNSVLDYLIAAADRCPEKTAFSDGETELTYGRVLALAQQVGAWVAAHVPTGSPVGVWALRTAYTPVLFLGAVFGGCFYVPLDPGLPGPKLKKILTHCAPPVILAERGPALPEGTAYEGEIVSLDRMTEEKTGRICPAPARDPQTPLYLIYTSGSTGEPKGVLKSHGAVISFLESYERAFGFSAEEVIGNQNPFCFDASAKDLYLTLSLGARMEILDTILFSFPVRLVEEMNRRRVTFISWVPSALSIVSQLGTFREIKPTTLRRVFFVGEVFPMKQLNRWRQALPQVQFVNLYGQSELAGICCYYEVQGNFSDTESLPIGGPLDNSRIYLWKDGRVIREPGTLGEIYVASPALALGYYKDPQKTAASFRTMELEPGKPERVFCTGDLAQYRNDGLLVFGARTDYQVKHMGHRIELGEIEAAAAALEDVERCCCLYDKERSKIVLFCQLTPGSCMTNRNILHKLKEQLASYMVPNRVRILPEIPLNPNGKADRQNLAQSL